MSTAYPSLNFDLGEDIERLFDALASDLDAMNPKPCHLASREDLREVKDDLVLSWRDGEAVAKITAGGVALGGIDLGDSVDSAHVDHLSRRRDRGLSAIDEATGGLLLGITRPPT